MCLDSFIQNCFRLQQNEVNGKVMWILTHKALGFMSFFLTISSVLVDNIRVVFLQTTSIVKAFRELPKTELVFPKQ